MRSMALHMFAAYIAYLIFSPKQHQFLLCYWYFLTDYSKLACRPLQYKLIMATSKSLVMINKIWLISAAYVVFGTFYYKGSSGIYVSPYGCDTKNYVFVTFCAICGFFIPTIIIMFIYACIFRIAQRRRKTTQKRKLGQTNQVESRRNSFYKDIKNVRMMAIVVSTFLLCWAPFFIFEIVQMYNSKSITISSKVQWLMF